MSAPTSFYATAVARYTPVGWRAVLLRGAPGSGKSDLALRLIAQGWCLVGDDQIQLWPSGGRLFVAPASNLKGLLEVRGLGIGQHRYQTPVRASLLCDCVAQEPERLPETARVKIAEHEIVHIELFARTASAPAKLLLGLDLALGLRRNLSVDRALQ